MGETGSAHAAIEEGYTALIDRAQKISHLEWGTHCLAIAPGHRTLLAWQERAIAPAVIEFGAPHGAEKFIMVPVFFASAALRLTP